MEYFHRLTWKENTYQRRLLYKIYIGTFERESHKRRRKRRNASLRRCIVSQINENHAEKTLVHGPDQEHYFLFLKFQENGCRKEI